MNNDDKLALLRYLIFIRGKLQHLSIELLLQGQDTQAVDQAEQQLAQKINELRSHITQQWNGNADTVMQQLRTLNEKAQNKIRELRQASDKAKKLGEFMHIIDEGLQLVTGLVA
jgi:vacuolar-type H+-ATPase subunit I/STV1